MYSIEKKIKETDKQKIDAFINRTPNGNVFQTYDFFKFWEQVDGFTPFCYIVKNQKDEILLLISGVVINEGGITGRFSKRAIIYGGPVIAEEIQGTSALPDVLAKINNDLKRKAIYIETRNFNDYTAYKSQFEKAGWFYKPHLNFHVDCTDDIQIKKRMSKSKVRQINKSLKEGAEIVVADNLDDVRTFFEILTDLYKSRVKTPLPGFDFFKLFFESELGIFLLIKFKGQIIGGIMSPILDRKVIYELYVCGQDGQIKNVYPSILATWAAIEYANKNAIPRFDFMGAGSPDKDYGVRDFKSKFGGSLVENGRFIKILNPFLYKTGQIGVKLLKSLR